MEISAAKPRFFSNEGASRSPFSRRLRRFSPRRAHADARLGGAFFAVCHRTPAHPEPRRAHLTDDPWRVRAFVQVCDRLTQSRWVMLHLKREGEVRHLLINYIPDTVRQRNDELPKPIARAHSYLSPVLDGPSTCAQGHEEDDFVVGARLEILSHPLRRRSRGDISSAVRAPIARPSPPLSHLALLLLLRSPPRVPLPASPAPPARF